MQRKDPELCDEEKEKSDGIYLTELAIRLTYGIGARERTGNHGTAVTSRHSTRSGREFLVGKHPECGC